MVAMNPEKVSP